jgi:hypothetical protein
MKNILLLACLLSLVLLLPGCSAITGCNYNDGPPNAPWTIVYSDQDTVRSGNVKPDGTFNVPKYGGESCSQIRQRVHFGTNLNLSLAASPSSVDLNNPPTSGTITGQGFDATYGMPRIDYFDTNTGFLMGSVEATSVNSAGTSLQANLPDLSSVYSGTYRVKVTNKTYDGFYLNIVGWTDMTGWGRDRPDSDGDGIYDDEDCDPYDPYNSSCAETCGGYGNEPLTLCGPI